jgi:hypothetical protein
MKKGSSIGTQWSLIALQKVTSLVTLMTPTITSTGKLKPSTKGKRSSATVKLFLISLKIVFVFFTHSQLLPLMMSLMMSAIG